MRTINISQTEVAALRAYKTDIKTMANHFGISTKEMREVLVQFGFAKPTKSSVDYVVNPVFDFDSKKIQTNDIIDSVTNFLNTEKPQEMVYSETSDSFVNS